MSRTPSDTFTFLLTDIEGSTRKWEDASAVMRQALEAHDAITRAAVEAEGGRLFKHTGDGCCAVFASATAAARAAARLQRDLADHDWGNLGSLRVRAAIHTGEAQERDGDFFGPALNRTARLMAAGHGGQVLLSLASEELVRDALDTDLDLVDLGDRRLRDLSRPERIFQLTGPGLDREFPALRTLDVGAHNLPVQATSFVGREMELVQLATLLAQHNLVTLAGVGGVGKTRLALQLAAAELPNFPQGAWLVELATVADPREVDRVVGSSAGAIAPITRESLLDYLHGKRCLLILDNCEHLIDACASLAAAILAACPEVRIIATSRETLGVHGEQTFRVPSLTLPASDDTDLERVTASSAIHLLAERARAVQPAFAVTAANASILAEIARRLDGIPLAIELAAARLRMMSPGELRDHLHDRFRILTGTRRGSLERHQTLRAAIDWSHDLLAGPAQEVARRLSVFTGGCTLKAAEAVCTGGSVDELEVLDLLTELVDKSLVQVEEGSQGLPTRYRLLETIRIYLAEKLQAAGERPATEGHHLEWVLALANSIPFNRWDVQLSHYLLVQSEVGNITAALERALEDGAAEAAARIAGNCSAWAWYIPGAYQQGIALTQAAYETGAGSDTDRANMATSLALMWQWSGFPETGAAWWDTAAEIARESPDLTGLDESTALISRTMASGERREDLEARSLDLIAADPTSAAADYVRFIVGTNALYWLGSHQEALDLLSAVWQRRHNESFGPYAAYLANLRMLARWLALGEAPDADERAAIRSRTSRDPGARLQALSLFALVDEQSAPAELKEAADVLRQTRATGFAVFFFGAAARLAARNEDGQRAIRLLGAGRSRSTMSGGYLAAWERIATGDLLDTHPEGEREALISEGAALTLDEALDLALRDEAG